MENLFLVGYIVRILPPPCSNNTGGEISKNYFCGSDQFLEACSP